jgi:hypothetical protein
MMRRRGPGLVGTMARTAVIAGTATVVSGAVAGHQQQKAMEKQQIAQAEAAQQQAAMEQAAAQAVAQQQASAAPPPAAAPAGGSDLMAELQKLGELKAAGILTDEEFAAAKAKLLA